MNANGTDLSVVSRVLRGRRRATLGNQVTRFWSFVLVASLLVVSSTAAAATVNSTKTGNWSDPTVWSTGIVPTAGDSVTIVSPHVVTVDMSDAIGSLTVNGTLQFSSLATGYTLTFAPGSIVSVGASGILDIGFLGVMQSGATGTTTLSLNLTATLKTSSPNGLGPIAGASFQNQGTGVWDLTTIDANGTVTYTGVGGGAFIVTDRNYNGLSITGSGYYTWTMAANRTVKGNFGAGPTNLTIVGTDTIFVGGNVGTGGPTAYTGGTSTIVMNGAGAYLMLPFLSSMSLNNLVIATSGTVTINGSSSSLTITNSLVISSGTLGAFAGATVNIAGSFVNNGTATMASGYTWSFGGNFTNNGTFNPTGNTITFNGTAAQTIGGSAKTTFPTMILNNAAGFTISGNDSVATSFTLQNGAVNITGRLALNAGATITRYGAGSISGGAPVFGTTVNVTYANSVSAPTITPGAEIPALTTVLNNLAVSGTTVNLASDMTVNGTLTIAASSLLNAGATNLTIKGAWSNSAGLAGFNPGTGSVTFSGAVGSTITGASRFNNLTVALVPTTNTLTVGAADSINGTFTLTSGTLSLGAQTLYMKGNFANNFSAAGFNAGTGTVVLGGTAAQSVGGSFPTTFYKLTMNNPAGATLGNNVTVNNILTLTSGNITTTVDTLSIGSAGSVSRTSGHIVGFLRKSFTTGSNVTKAFEVGTGVDYTPASLTFASITTAGSLTATTVNTEHPNIATSGLDATKDANRYWSIGNTGLVFTNYSATLNFVPTDVDAGADPTKFEVRKYDAPNWNPTTTGTVTTTSTQATGLTSMSDFAVGTVIPVTPAVPTLATPANLSTNIVVTPTLTWNSVYGATSYGLQVATDPGFTNLVVNQTGLTSTSYAILAPLNNSTQYYWQVNASNSAGTSAFSAPWSFTTIIAIPPAPVLATPTNGTIGVSTTPTLTWNAATGASTYRVQIAADSGFVTIVKDSALIAGTSYTPSSPLGTSSTYYWRVDATNVGGTGPWSAFWSFATIVAAPAVPTLLTPANNATSVATLPTLTWNAVLGATSYQLQVATDAGFSSIVLDQSAIVGNSFTLVTPLSAATVYYWHVNATNGGGTSSFSTAWSFTTRGPSTITSTKTGNWNDATVWNTGYVPGLGDSVVVATGHTVSMNASATIRCLTVVGTLQFNNTTTPYMFTFAAGSIVTVNGTLDMGILGVLQTGASGTTTVTMGASGVLKTSNVNGLGPVASASLQTQGTGVFDLTGIENAGTVNYVGTSAVAYVVTDRNYCGLTVSGTGNFTWTMAANRTLKGSFAAGATNLTIVGTDTIFVAGNFGAGGPAAYTGGTSTIVMNGAGTTYLQLPFLSSMSLNNLVIATSGTVTINGSSSSITITNSLLVSSGTLSAFSGAGVTIAGSFVNNGTVTMASGYTWSFGGNFTNNGTFNPTGNTITFNGAGAQTIGGSAKTTFPTMILNNAAGITISGNDSVATTLTLQNGAVNITGRLALNNAATITRYGAGSISGGVPVFGTTVNVSYANSVSAPTITPGAEIPVVTTVLSGFTVNGTTVNLAADLTVNGTLSIASAGLLNAGSTTITIKGAWSNSVGAAGFNGGTGTVLFATTVSGTLTGATVFNNLTVASGIFTLTMGAAETVNGTFTLTSGFVALAAQNLTLNGNFVNNATVASFTATTGTVFFSGTAAQTISGTSATTFMNININNALGVTLVSNAKDSVGLTLQNGVFTLTGTLTLGNSATITRYGAGSLSGTPTFGTLVNVTYMNSVSAPTITPSGEIPASPTVLNNLTVNATTVNLAAGLTVNGNLTLTGAAAILNAGTANISMKGAWSNGASVTAFNAGTATVSWIGGSTSIGGSFATTFNNLTVALTPATSTLTLTTAPTINGALTLTSGIVALGAQNLTVNGDFTNNAGNRALTASSGTIFFSGTVAQAVGGTFATTFPNLSINNAAGVTLSSTDTVSTLLTLQNGTLTMSGTLVLANAATINRYTVASISAPPTFGTSVNVTYTYNATTPSITTGAEMPTTNILTNLTLSGALTLNLDRDLIINGTISLGTGTLAVGTHNVTFLATVTPGTGSITSAVTGTVSYLQTTIGQTVAQGSYGNLTFNSFGKTLTSTAPIHIAGVFTPGLSLAHVVTGSTVDYNGTTPQTIPAAFGSYNSLMISNTAGVTLGGSVTLSGDFTDNGLFTAGSTTVTCNGTIAQNILGTSPTTFTNLTVNKSAGTFTLGANVTVTGVLTMTAGVITTGANSLTIENGGSVARTSGFVAGNLRKYVPTGAGVAPTFEVGTGTTYAPVNVTFANVSGTGYLTGSTTAGDNPNVATSLINAAKSVNRFWTLANSGIVFDTYGAVFNFVAGDVDAGANTANFVVGKYNSPTWTAPTVGVRTATSTQVLGLSSFSDFEIGEPLIVISGNAGVLGVTLSYTDGTPKTATSDSLGNYSFAVTYNWSGTVTPSLTGYTFTPPNIAYVNVVVNQTLQNYVATPITFTISGNAGAAGVTLSYTDGTPKTATADGAGAYSFTVSYNWSGTVTPSLTGAAFTPVNRTYTNVLANQTLQNYTENIVANVKVFLQGPFNAGAMTTTLNSSGLIPHTSDSAYSTVTYGYTASTVAAIPNASVVDWLFVELRSGTTGATKVAVRAGFLKSDGTVADTDGVSPLSFTGVLPGNYYVVLRHRNHLAIMSAAAVALTSTSTLYDFTTSQSQAYGTTPMAALAGGSFGLVAGDANGSGVVTVADILLIIPGLNGNGYNALDINMSGVATVADILLMIPNLNLTNNVPN